MANVTGWFAEVSAGITVPRMSATAVMEAPDISVNSAINITAPRMTAAGVLKVPALGLSTTLTIPRMAATGAMAVPVVSNAFNVGVTAPRMNAAGALAVPAVNVSADIAPPRMTATAAMAVPVVANNSGANYTDTFNRSNSASLGANWNTDTSFGSLAIASNAAATTSLGGNVYVSPMNTGNNQITVVMKGTPPAGDFAYIIARSDNSTNYSAAAKNVYLLMSQGGAWTLARNQADSGVSTSGNESWADGDIIIFSCVGSTLTVKRNGSTVLTTGGATDLAAGYVELFAFSVSGNSFGFDSFTAQDI